MSKYIIQIKIVFLLVDLARSNGSQTTLLEKGNKILDYIRLNRYQNKIIMNLNVNIIKIKP